MASSNQEEHDVDVSLASRVEEALLAGPSPLPLDHRDEPGGELGCGLRCSVGDLLVCASFFNRFSLARRFWNQTWEQQLNETR